MGSQEVWKPARGYDGYEVSNHGYVRDTVTGKLINFCRANGRIIVNIYKDNKMTGVTVARLVLESFTGIMPPGPRAVIYKDGNRKNINLDNLMWP